MFFAVTLISLVALTGARDFRVCPEDNGSYKEFNGVCYHFVLGNSKIYDDAEQDCETRRETLAIILSEETNNFIQMELNEIYGRSDHVWIGLTDLAKENEFRWANGSDLAYKNFAEGNGPKPEGYSFDILSTFEDCVAFNPVEGNWHDWRCSGNLAPKKDYICQFDVIPVCPVVDEYHKDFNGVCYHFVLDQTLQYFDAKADCESRNQTMAIIPNQEVNEFLQTELVETFSQEDHVWVGLEDVVEGEFEWADGTQFNYSNFAEGNGPLSNPIDPQGRLEDCVAIDPLDGKWHDLMCNGLIAPRQKFICQFVN